MPETTEVGLDDPLTRCLACAALSPGLRSVLVFDIDPGALEAAASVLGELLRECTGRAWGRVTLGSSVTDAALWGSTGLEPDATTFRVGFRPGLLSQGADQPRVVVIPDLAGLSLPAAQACVAFAGSGVAHLERDGEDRTWAPTLCWLAGCRRDDVGRVSPHLLDRFALRLVAGKPTPGERAAALKREVPRTGGPAEFRVTNEARDALRTARDRHPMFSPEVLADVFKYLPLDATASPRREIALARLAHAEARLDPNAPAMTPRHVTAAALAVGLIRPESPSSKTQPGDAASGPGTTDSPNDRTEAAAAPGGSAAAAERPGVFDATGTGTVGPVALAASPSEILAPALIEIARDADPYPEDHADVLREARPLRLPPGRAPEASAHGAAIGAEPTDQPFDLDYVSTLLEAAKYQRIRHKNRAAQGDDARRFRVAGSDLRKHRRAPVPERALILVLDFTSLRDCEWRNALQPYLAWAYVGRAGVTVVRVGAAGAANELRAEAVSASSLLTPRVASALEALPGQATPLAHGFELASQAVRKALMKGSGRVGDGILLVAVTDGRGNVPLAVSLGEPLTPPVGRAGVDDALAAASRLRGLKRIRAVLLDPRPQQHTELPSQLAAALGAQAVPIPLVEEATV